MSQSLNVLMIEDSADDAELILMELRRRHFNPTCHRIETRDAMNLALRSFEWDVIISDYTLPDFSAPDAFGLMKEAGLDIPFIIVSGTVGEETSVEAMRTGVNDYLLKGKLARLVPVIEREIRERHERAARRQAEANLRKTEEQLRQAQKMEAVGRLAGGVAHDFNNIMSVILGYTSFLLEAVRTGDPLRNDLEEVEKAAKRAGSLTNQLLALSRQQVLEPRVIDLSAVINSMESMLRRLLREDVELSLVTSSEVGNVFVDPGQIEQVLMNLIINARDAMPHGGTMTIETHAVDVDFAQAGLHDGIVPGQYVVLHVSDTGVGMSEDTQRRIFEPFFTTKPKGQGTGLGLSTVFGIVRQSGGQIWVFSELGKGTTFKIYLPRTDVAVESVARAIRSSTLSTRGTETILVVEDEDQVRGVMLTALRRSGYNVLEARNGKEALVLFEAIGSHVDLVVTDVIMPQMNGRELADRLAIIRPKLRILYVSGYTENAIAHHGVLDPGSAFLQKPVTPDVLVRKVRDLLDSSKT